MAPQGTIGMGITIDADEGTISIVVSMIGDEDSQEPLAYSMLTPEHAMAIAGGLLSMGHEAAHMQEELEQMSPEGRAAMIQDLIIRAKAGSN